MSTHSRAACEPAGAALVPEPEPQPAASVAAESEAAAHPGRGKFEAAPYVAQSQQPKVPATRTSVTLLPVIWERVVMTDL